MQNNGFENMDIVSMAVAFFAGLWGAFFSFIRRDKEGKSIGNKVGVFIVDMIINVGITMLAYIGLVGYGINELLSVAISGFVGHQGTRTFYLAELIIAEKFGAKKTFEKIVEEKKK
jgi:hypothetical protein